MKRLGLKFLISIVFLQIGCSQQYRTADSGRSWAEIKDVLEDMEINSLIYGGQAVDDFYAILSDPGMVLYYGAGPGPMGGTENIFAFPNMDFLGEEFYYLESGEIEEGHVYFVMQNDGGGNFNVAIMIDALAYANENFTTLVLSGQGQINGGEFSATLVDEFNRVIILRSRDVVDGALAGVIQLKVYIDEGGGEQYVGKFSTLVGFGP